MDGDQVVILFIGFLLFQQAIERTTIFVSVDERAEERDRKRGWLVLPRTNFFSPYYFSQVRWYKWVTAGMSLILGAMFIAHAFGLLDQYL